MNYKKSRQRRLQDLCNGQNPNWVINTGGPYWMKNLIGYQIFLKRFCAKAFKGRFAARRPTLLSWKKKENVT